MIGISSILYGLHYKFALASKGKPSCKEEIDNFVFGLLDQSDGIAFGEYHGAYAYPMFVEERAEKFAEKGVTSFFCEAVPAAKQPCLDLWQDHDNAQPLIDLFNKRSMANSTYQFEHYWRMLKALHQANIRIYAAGYVPEQGSQYSMKDANDIFVNGIRRVQPRRSLGEKYMMFGGRGHFAYLYEGEKGVGYSLNIPVVQLDEGPYRLARNALSPQEHIIQLPQADHQIAYFRGPVTRHRKIE